MDKERQLIRGYRQNLYDAQLYQPVNEAEAEISRRRVEAATKYLKEHGESFE